MKKSTKAVLYSTFIFPGIGLLVLKQYWRAFLFIVPAGLAVVYLTTTITTAANKVSQEMVHQAEQGLLVVDITTIDSLSQKIYENILTALAAQQTQLNFSEYIFIASWICSIVSSYFVGKKMEEQDQLNAEALLKNIKK